MAPRLPGDPERDVTLRLGAFRDAVGTSVRTVDTDDHDHARYCPACGHRDPGHYPSCARLVHPAYPGASSERLG